MSLIQHIQENTIKIEEDIRSTSVKAAGSVGSFIGNMSSNLTSEKSNWKKAIAKHDVLILKLKRKPGNKILRKSASIARVAKEKARAKYVFSRDRLQKRSSSIAKKGMSATADVVGKGSETVVNAAKRIRKSISNISPPHVLSAMHNYVTTNFHR